MTNDSKFHYIGIFGSLTSCHKINGIKRLQSSSILAVLCFLSEILNLFCFAEFLCPNCLKECFFFVANSFKRAIKECGRCFNNQQAAVGVFCSFDKLNLYRCLQITLHHPSTTPVPSAWRSIPLNVPPVPY